MPAQPLWHLRIPEILARLRAPGAPPFLDRPAIEQLFRVRRRQAVRLLNTADGYQIGKTFLVDRPALIGYLEDLERSGVSIQARARKQRVLTALNEASGHLAAQRVQIPTGPAGLGQRVADLPSAIQVVAPGRLQIAYSSAEELLGHIAALVAAATSDFPAFRSRFERGDP